jgi:hypothetical protein
MRTREATDHRYDGLTEIPRMDRTTELHRCKVRDGLIPVGYRDGRIRISLPDGHGCVSQLGSPGLKRVCRVPTLEMRTSLASHSDGPD